MISIIICRDRLAWSLRVQQKSSHLNPLSFCYSLNSKQTSSLQVFTIKIFTYSASSSENSWQLRDRKLVNRVINSDGSGDRYLLCRPGERTIIIAKCASKLMIYLKTVGFVRVSLNYRSCYQNTRHFDNFNIGAGTLSNGSVKVTFDYVLLRYILSQITMRESESKCLSCWSFQV